MVNRQCEVEDRDRPKTDFPFSVRLGLGLTLDFPFLFFEKNGRKRSLFFDFDRRDCFIVEFYVSCGTVFLFCDDDISPFIDVLENFDDDDAELPMLHV